MSVWFSYWERHSWADCSVTSQELHVGPDPNFPLKTCLDDLVPLVTAIFNASFATSTIPRHFKQVVVIPLLKKSRLDTNNLKHFRPVSSLLFVWKILEKVVLRQLQKRLSDNSLLEMCQDCCVECPWLSVTEGFACVSVLLNFSTAFNVLDHSILLKRLTGTFRVWSIVLEWFASCVHDCNHPDIVDGIVSAPSSLVYGVPQGSFWDLFCSHCTASFCWM